MGNKKALGFLQEQIAIVGGMGGIAKLLKKIKYPPLFVVWSTLPRFLW